MYGRARLRKKSNVVQLFPELQAVDVSLPYISSILFYAR